MVRLGGERDKEVGCSILRLGGTWMFHLLFRNCLDMSIYSFSVQCYLELLADRITSIYILMKYYVLLNSKGME
jgi:hypothetical protein